MCTTREYGLKFRYLITQQPVPSYHNRLLPINCVQLLIAGLHRSKQKQFTQVIVVYVLIKFLLRNRYRSPKLSYNQAQRETIVSFSECFSHRVIKLLKFRLLIAFQLFITRIVTFSYTNSCHFWEQTPKMWLHYFSASSQA